MSRPGVFSPSSEPLLPGVVRRGQTKVRQQSGGGGGGEFPFQWSHPGIVNFLTVGAGIPTIGGYTLNSAYWTLADTPTSGSIGVDIFVTGVLQTSFSFSTGSGNTAISVTVPAGGIVGISLTSVGSADAAGLWIGLAP